MAIYRLKNKVMDYAWGSTSYIQDLLGLDKGKPAAELWLGAHPKSPSLAIVEGNPMPLDTLLDSNPKLLGMEGKLPYLFKVLAAREPLSIQAHPNLTQAKQGFQRENLKGIPLSAFNRNYRDSNHKPELFVALTPFTALVGFRELADIKYNFSKYCPQNYHSLNWRDHKAFFCSLMSGTKVSDLVSEALANSSAHDLVSRLNKFFPFDVGVLSPLYLNIVQAQPGQAMYLESGVLHAYVEGSILEIMANSDNVLRGGLTKKHVDVNELLSVLDFTPHVCEVLTPVQRGTQKVYESPASEFELSLLGEGTYRATFCEILLCITGNFSVSGFNLKRGDSLFVASKQPYKVTGTGKLYRAKVAQKAGIL